MERNVIFMRSVICKYLDCVDMSKIPGRLAQFR